MKQYNHSSHKSLLHYPNCLTLIQKKLVQHLVNSQPVFSLPSSRSLYEMQSLFFTNSAFQNCANIMGNPMYVWLHVGNLLMIQLIVNIPLTFVSTGSPLEMTCMQLLIVNHQLHDRSMIVN